MEHTSPRFNLNGNLISGRKTFMDQGKVKDPWENNVKIKTRDELMKTRKEEMKPDPSYDLDGDGHVGNLDLFVSKRFDLDRDGKLNKQERENAEKALKEGYLNNFKIGLESQVPKTSLRIMQKRGVIIENDYTEKLIETYPMPRYASLPSISSRTQLLNQRKQALLQTSRPVDNVFRIEVTQGTPEGFVNEPRFTTATALKNAYKNSIREKMGMTNPSDIKNFSTPSLSYVPDPIFKSQSSMNQIKKKELLESLHNNANYNHINREKHLLEREKLLISHNEGKTIEQIRESQRLATNEYNQKTFSNIAIGVHGKELPKFSENQKEFWKLKESWQDSRAIPPTATLKTLQHKSELDSRTLKPVQSEIVLKKPSNSEVTDKPNHIIPYGTYIPVENTDSSYKIPLIKYRMSTIFGHFLESAAEMGINFLPQSEPRPEKKGKNYGLETSIGPASDIPKTSQSVNKKLTSKTVLTHNPLRTTGFCEKRKEEG